MERIKMKYAGIVLVAALLFGSISPAFCQESDVASDLEKSLQKQGYVNIHDLDADIRVNLKYATKDNFTKHILYIGLKNAYIQADAGAKLVLAKSYLKKIHPDYTFIVYDAARPLSIQRSMYQVVRNTPYAPYVANPDRTGLHNYGLAVDLSICDQSGRPLDMGTPFDYFGSKAGIRKEDELLAKHILTKKEVLNRRLLRSVMQKAGFYPYLVNGGILMQNLYLWQKRNIKLSNNPLKYL